MADDPTNEFDRAEKTPARALWTNGERRIVLAFIRTSIKTTVPYLPRLATVIGPALVGFILTTAQHWKGKAETEEKVEEARVEAKETTKRAYRGLAKPTRDLAAELAALDARVTATEATQKAQSALLVARERDFVIEGRPALAQRRRVDAGLVQAVKANAAKDSKELASRKSKPAPAVAPPPLELPPAPPKAATAPAAVSAAPGVQPILTPVPNPTDAAKP